MQRSVKKWLYDVRDACLAIHHFVSGLTLDEYRASELITSAVECKFEIIGEATLIVSDIRMQLSKPASRMPVISFASAIISYMVMMSSM
jgi:uncharacterized protein with HEPN domain